MNAECFAARLRELRDQSGLTQQQLADAAGLTREGVAQLETGRREPAWRTVVGLCQALSVTADAFLQESSSHHEAKRGRPRKASTEANGDQPKKTTKKRKIAKCMRHNARAPATRCRRNGRAIRRASDPNATRRVKAASKN